MRCADVFPKCELKFRGNRRQLAFTIRAAAIWITGDWRTSRACSKPNYSNAQVDRFSERVLGNSLILLGSIHMRF
jgi:hypothetical protein